VVECQFVACRFLPSRIDPGGQSVRPNRWQEEGCCCHRPQEDKNSKAHPGGTSWQLHSCYPPVVALLVVCAWFEALGLAYRSLGGRWAAWIRGVQIIRAGIFEYYIFRELRRCAGRTERRCALWWRRANGKYSATVVASQL
jgi:hypothetical protein